MSQLEKEKRKLNKALKGLLNEEDLEVITSLFIQELLDKVAIDSTIAPYERTKIRGFSEGSWGVEKGYISRHLRKILDLFVEE